MIRLEDGRFIRVSYESQRGLVARIGIEAPREIAIVREELCGGVEQERSEAS